jgi:G:T-mismatch repair DNA endonuclease (very short patch repair protein)
MHGRQPTANEWHWAPKLRRTVERDRQAVAVLEASDWLVIRIWEHEELGAAASSREQRYSGGEETNVAVGGQLTNPAPPAGERTGSR